MNGEEGEEGKEVDVFILSKQHFDIPYTPSTEFVIHVYRNRNWSYKKLFYFDHLVNDIGVAWCRVSCEESSSLFGLGRRYVKIHGRIKLLFLIPRPRSIYPFVAWRNCSQNGAQNAFEACCYE